MFGKDITPDFSASLGYKDKNVHISASPGFVRCINWLQRMVVNIWDEDTKRSWVVNGTNIVLHMFRAFLDGIVEDESDEGARDESQDKNKLYVWPERDFRSSRDPHGIQGALGT